MSIERKKLKLDADMYQAWITGLKTQTRRPIKNVEQHEDWGTAFVLNKDEDDYLCIERYPEIVASQCPYGTAGDVITVHLDDTEEFRLAKIVSVRPERLHDISEQDCIAEGVYPVGDRFHNYKYPTQPTGSAKRAFRELWQKYYPLGSGYHSDWRFNPYVWVIELEPYGWEVVS